MMQCPNCETENRDDARFCDECGFPLGNQQARAPKRRKPVSTSSLEAQDHESKSALSQAPEETVVAAGEGLESNEQFDKVIDEPYERDGASVEAVADEFSEIRSAAAIESAQELTGEPASQAYGEESETFNGEDDLAKPSPASSWDVDPYLSYKDQDPFEVTDDFESMYTQPTEDAYAFFPEQQVEESPASQTRPLTSDRGSSWRADTTVQMPRVDKEGPHGRRDFVISSAKKKSKGLRTAIVAIVGVIIGIGLVAALTYALGFWGGIAVPDVTGMTEADAKTALESEGFSVRTTQVKSDDTEGLVLIMDPPAGSRAPEGSEVVIHIATARFVPNIIGKNGDEAAALLKEAGYDNVRYEKEFSDDEENIVLSVSPESGTRAKSSMEIIVTVSEAYRVPDISGLDLQAAQNAITEAGLVPSIIYIDTDQYADGTIMGTKPDAGTKVTGGDYVSINVARARGIELVGLTEELLSQGSTVTIGGVDYEIESLVSVSYQGNDVVAFTASGRPKITFFGETLYASSSQTVTGQVEWSEDNEVISIS